MLSMEAAVAALPPTTAAPSSSIQTALYDTRRYVLHYGLKEKRQRKLQSEAYLKVQQKIVTRSESARALTLSGNLLGMSVMASQLSMYRWKVSEAQTMLKATSILQEEVLEATKKGFQVRRTARQARRGKSKYADRDALKRLFEKKIEQIQRRAERREKRKVAATEAGEDLAMALADVVDSASVSLSDVSSDESGDDEMLARRETHNVSAVSGGGGSDDDDGDGSRPRSRPGMFEGDGSRCNVPPGDMVSSVVIVDRFTHESYEEVVHHLRFLDEKYQLNLVIILLLPMNDESRELQGVGSVLQPEHQVTLEEAYKFGYDLVITHCFDHTVVEFLTDTFVSSSGRWRNDVRAKAAVGNYISLKNILQGRIDIQMLKQLAWNDEVNDAELLDMIGKNSLALHGEAKRIGLAGKTLSSGPMQGVAAGNGVGADGLSNLSPLPTNLGTFRTRPMNVHGVNVPKDVFTPLEDLTAPRVMAVGSSRDMIGNVMAPHLTSGAQHTVRRRRKNADPEDESEDAYEYVLVSIEEENRNAVQQAFEDQMTLLISETDQKSRIIENLMADVERLTRTVAVLKRNGEGGGETPRFREGAGEADGFSGSLMNLSKEQQIYILKERLDIANEQVAALMEDGNQRRSRSLASRDGRGGLGNSWSMNSAGGNNDGGGRVNKKLQSRNRRVYRSYGERREAHIISLYDVDAGGGGRPCPGPAISPRDAKASASRRIHEAIDSPDAKRRSKDFTAKVMDRLQSSMIDCSNEKDNETLQSAMDLIRSQQERTAQLEEMLRLSTTMLDASVKADATVPSAPGAGKKKKKAASKASSSVTSRGAVEDDDEGDESVAVAVGRRNANRKGHRGSFPGKSHKAQGASGDEAAIMEALREEVEQQAMERQEAALEAAERRHQVELRKRGAVVKSLLEKLYLRIRRPYTQEYVDTLENDKKEVLSKARGVQQRFQLLLSTHRKSGVTSEEEEAGGVFDCLDDPEVKHTAEKLAREHASCLVKAHQIQTEMDAVMKKIGTAEGRAEFDEAVEQWENYREETEKAAANSHGTNCDLYLQCLQEELQAESELQRWGTTSAVADVIEKGRRVMDDMGSPTHNNLQGTFSFVGFTLGLPKVSEEDSEGNAAAGAGGEGDGKTRARRRSNTIVSTRQPAEGQMEMQWSYCDPFLEDLHQVFFTTVNPNMDEVKSMLAAGNSRSEASLKKKSATKTLGSRRSNAPVGGNASTSQKTTGSQHGGSTSSSKHHVPQSNGTFLTGTDIEESQPYAPSFARASGSRGAGEEEELAETDDPDRSSYSPFSDHPSLTDVVADATPGKLNLYNAALSGYRSGYVHPDRMIDLERMARQPNDGEGAAATAGLSDQYLSHHQELLRLLQLLALRTPALGAVLEGHTEEMEVQVSEDLLRGSSPSSRSKLGEASQTQVAGQPGDGRPPRPPKRPPSGGGSAVTVPFLLAYDTAVVTWYVDYLCRTMPEHKTAVQTGIGYISAEELRPNRQLHNMGPEDERLQLYEDVVTVLTQPYGLAAVDPGQWASPVVRPSQSSVATGSKMESGSRISDIGGSSDGSVTSLVEPALPRRTILDNILLSRSRSHLSGAVSGSNHSLAGGDAGKEQHQTIDVSHLPEDVAALFTVRHEGRGAGGLSAAELYLETGLDNEDDMTDENIQLMRDIKLELAYLEQLKEERMAELRLRYKYRMKQISLREKNVYEGVDGPTPSELEVPDFEVKEGTAAWYGMEAAKRVKDILRRRQKPDQIILGGSGAVGVEMSKRVAFPIIQKDLDVIHSIEDRVRAAHRVLPPLRRRGLSRWQQQFYRGLPEPADLGYIGPRDEAIVNAFGRMASINQRQEGYPYIHSLNGEDTAPSAELSERVMAFRESLQGMTGSGPGASAEGSPSSSRFTALSTGPIPRAPDISEITRAANRRMVAKLDLTSWVYGVPSEELQQSLDHPPPPTEEPGRGGSVVFLPDGECAYPSYSAATDKQRRSGPGMAIHSGATGGGQRVLPRQNSIYNPYKVLGSDSFVTPSALAAQRLSVMLRGAAADRAVPGRYNFFSGGSNMVPAQGRSQDDMDIPLPGRSSIAQALPGELEQVLGKPAPLSVRRRSVRGSVSSSGGTSGGGYLSTTTTIGSPSPPSQLLHRRCDTEEPTTALTSSMQGSNVKDFGSYSNVLSGSSSMASALPPPGQFDGTLSPPPLHGEGHGQPIVDEDDEDSDAADGAGDEDEEEG